MIYITWITLTIMVFPNKYHCIIKPGNAFIFFLSSFLLNTWRETKSRTVVILKHILHIHDIKRRGSAVCFDRDPQVVDKNRLNVRPEEKSSIINEKTRSYIVSIIWLRITVISRHAILVSFKTMENSNLMSSKSARA